MTEKAGRPKKCENVNWRQTDRHRRPSVRMSLKNPLSVFVPLAIVQCEINHALVVAKYTALIPDMSFGSWGKSFEACWTILSQSVPYPWRCHDRFRFLQFQSWHQYFQVPWLKGTFYVLVYIKKYSFQFLKSSISWKWTKRSTTIMHYKLPILDSL